MEKTNWSKIDNWIVELSGKIKLDKFEPTLLVALARGGWVPTRLLSNALKVKRLASIGLTYSDVTRTKLISYSFPEPINKGDKILLIEDRLETGQSLVVATNLIEARGVEVRTACFFIRTDTIVTPHYFLSTIDAEISFPWE